MPSKVIVGVQWGDEGKGKIIDILASRSDVVVRSQGGNNAGHTVHNSKGIYKLRLIPSGILYPNVECYIGCGTVIDPKSLLEEIEEMQARGITCDNLRIDPRAHIVMPWHILIDSLAEDLRGKEDIGTTRRGIGPCYMDKCERTGLRMYDLTTDSKFREKVISVGNAKNQILTKLYAHAPMDLEKIISQYTKIGKVLKKYTADVSVLTYSAYKQNKNILFEGAQGTLLDLDVGTYPFVTSSNPISGGVCTGTGIGPTMIDEVLGVSKAYTTRVGKGPFPTELNNKIGEKIRQVGNEFGTNTGRPRRVGWFDAVIVRHAVRVNGLTCLAVNKLDTLSGFETLKICTSYKKEDGTILKDFPASFEELAQCTAVFEDIPGFSEDVTGCKTFAELPQSCKNYIARLEELCGCPIQMVGVGPGRHQNLER